MCKFVLIIEKKNKLCQRHTALPRPIVLTNSTGENLTICIKNWDLSCIFLGFDIILQNNCLQFYFINTINYKLI